MAAYFGEVKVVMKTKRSRLFFMSWLLVGGLVITASLYLARGSWQEEEATLAPESIYDVKRASFNVTIAERGVVRPARIAPIKSEISSDKAKIVWLMKEGVRINEGQVVARFDTKPFQDDVARLEQQYSDANATLGAAEKLLMLQEEEEHGKIEEAERKVEIAAIEAENIKNGSGPLEKKQVEQKVMQAERRHRLAASYLEDMRMLLKRGHASKREFEKAEDEFETAKEEVNVAREELANFNEFKWPKMMREAELLVNASRSELQRVLRTAALQIQNRVGQVEKARRKVASGLHLLENARGDLRNCVVRAPADGILLYSEVPRENGTRKIQIGDSIWVGQTFLEVPDTHELVVEIQIREVDVAKISSGMRAVVKLDAMPWVGLQGEVENVSSLAEDDRQNANIRRFFARIQLDEKIPEVHVGMSATVEIIHQEVNDVLVIPAAAVVFKNDSTNVYKVAGGSIELTDIELGAQGVQWVQVVGGLKEGDRIRSTLY